MTPFLVKPFGPINGWPKGGFSLYQVSAEDIARSIGFDRDGAVNRRDSLNGFIAAFEDLDGVQAEIARLINADKKAYQR